MNLFSHKKTQTNISGDTGSVKLLEILVAVACFIFLTPVTDLVPTVGNFCFQFRNMFTNKFTLTTFKWTEEIIMFFLRFLIKKRYLIDMQVLDNNSTCLNIVLSAGYNL